MSARWEFHVLSEAWYYNANISPEYDDEITVELANGRDGDSCEVAFRWYTRTNAVRLEAFDDAWMIFAGRENDASTKMLKALAAMKNPTVAEMKAMLLDCGMTDATEREFPHK